MKKVCVFLGLMLAVCAAVCVFFPGIVSDIYSEATNLLNVGEARPVQIFGMMEVQGCDEIGAFSEGLAPVRIGDHWGYVDRLGDLVIEAKWHNAGAFSEGLACVEGEHGYGYIDRNGNLVVEAQWDEGAEFSGGYAWVSEYSYTDFRTDYCIVDKTGKMTKVDAGDVMILEPFSEGLVVAYRDGKAGFINTKGEFAIDAVYSDAKRFSGGLAAVCRDGRWGYINKRGRMVIPNTWAEAITFSDDGQGIVHDRSDKTYKFIGKSGFTRADLKWNVNPSVLGEPKSIDEFFSHVRTWNKLTEMQVDYVGYSEGLTLVKAKDGTMGFLDRGGNLVIDAYYDDSTKLSREWASLDVFSSGLAMGRSASGHTYGYINRDGKRVCHATFQKATRFDEGLATASAENKFYILYVDDVADDVVNALFDRGEYGRIASLVSNSAERCYAWETYYQNDTKKMESFFEGAIARLNKNEAYLDAAEIYRALGDIDAWMNAHLMYAEKLLAGKEFEEARQVILKGRRRSGGMSDGMAIRVLDMENRINCAEAMQLLESRNYADAIDAFAALGNYEDSEERRREAHYRLGEQLKAEGRLEEAMLQMVKAGNYADARDQVEAYYLPEVQRLTARGEYRRAALALMRIGLPEFLREAYALRSHYLMDDRIAWDQYSWDRVIALSADGTPHTDYDEHGMNGMLEDEKDLVAVEICSGTLFGLRRDGTVYGASMGYDVSGWTDIVAFAAGERFLVGLRADGTVVGVGRNAEGQLNLEGWRDVIAVECDYNTTYGLCRDGSILSAGKQDPGVSVQNGWHDLVDLAIGSDVAGLREDGMILLSRGNRTWQVQAPEGTVAIETGFGTVLCLMEDGTVTAPDGTSDVQFKVKAYQNQVALVDDQIFVDSEGRLLPDEINEGIELDESRASDRFVPPAVLTGEKAEWLAHAQELLENGAYRRAMELLAFRRDDPQASELYRNAAYALAEALYASGDYDGVAAIDERLGGDSHVSELLLGVYYAEGMRLLAEGEAERAITMFEKAGNYQDAAEQAERIRAEQSGERYAQVEALRAEGRELEALYALRRLGDRKSLKEAYAGLYAYDRKKPGIEAEDEINWTLSKDGTIQLSGHMKEVHPKIGNMSGFMACTGNHKIAFGLTPEGELYQTSRAEESGWAWVAENIVAVDCTPYNYIALREDGTVLFSWWDQLSDYYEIPEGALDLSGWTDIVAVEINDRYAVGLKRDGTVVAQGIASTVMDVGSWTDIVDITSGRDVTVGLKSDGTVVVASSHADLIRGTEGWTDVVEIAAYPSMPRVVGVRRNGSQVEAED